MVSMAAPIWYSWTEFDLETHELRPDAPPKIVKKYKRERERSQKEHRELWAQMENGPNVELVSLEDG